MYSLTISRGTFFLGFLLITIIFLSSCNTLTESDDVIAECYDYALKKSDIHHLFSENLSPLDSTAIVKSYIDNWAKQMAILSKAENNLSEDQKNVDDELNEYRNSLIIYKYESELINQQLDTTIREEEIEDYYNNHSRNFPLKQDIVKAFYLKVNKGAPKLDDVKRWIRSDKDEDRITLDEYCFQFGEDYVLGDDDWMAFETLLKKAPLNPTNIPSLLRYNKYLETADSLHLYFIRINDYKLKETISPLEFERENIQNLILNQRKLALIKEMEIEALQNAYNKNEIKIFN